MKRISCLLGAVLLCLFFSACTSAEREEAAAAETMENLASVLTTKDADGLKALFAPFVLDQTNAEGALDTDIRHILAYFSGSIVSQSMQNYKVCDYLNQLEPWEYIDGYVFDESYRWLICITHEDLRCLLVGFEDRPPL